MNLSRSASCFPKSLEPQECPRSLHLHGLCSYFSLWWPRLLVHNLFLPQNVSSVPPNSFPISCTRPLPLPPEERNSPRKTPKLEGTKEGSSVLMHAPPHTRVHALCSAFHGPGLAVAGSAQLSEAKWLTERLRHFPPQFKFVMNKQASTRFGDNESKADPDAEQQASKRRQAVSPRGWQRTLFCLEAAFQEPLAGIPLST